MSQFNQVKIARENCQRPPLSANWASRRVLLLRLCYLLLAIGVASSLSACSGVRRSVLNEDVRKVRAAKQVRLEDKVQEFGDKTHKFKMLPPKGFLYSQMETAHGQLFSFSTPPRKDGRVGVFTVSCVANQGRFTGQKNILPENVLSSVLEPLAQSCIDFHVGLFESSDEKGRSFVSTQFTGSYGGYYPIVGYVYVTPVPGGFYIVQWQDGEVHFPLTKKVMLDSFKSMEIEY